MKIFWTSLSIFCIISTLMPFLNVNHWLVRMFDFPHAQLTLLTLISLIMSYWFVAKNNWFTLGLLSILILIFIYQCTLIYRYTPLKPVQSHDAEQSIPNNEVSILSSNVLMTNRKSENLIKQIKEENPAIVILLEVDEWWIKQVDFVKKTHPYYIETPIDNLYGMAVYSRLKWENPTVKYLVEDDIPSLEAVVSLPSGQTFDLYILHPKPPSPVGNEESTERDGELLIVGRKVEKKGQPAVVIGDLNDVAWSRTTRLFQKVSGLLDPRIGRGFFNTFHADYPFMRWPLDHAFHSEHFKLRDIKRMPHVHSDHFPIYVKLQYSEIAKIEQEKPTATAEEKEEAKKKIQEAQ